MQPLERSEWPMTLLGAHIATGVSAHGLDQTQSESIATLSSLSNLSLSRTFVRACEQWRNRRRRHSRKKKSEPRRMSLVVRLLGLRHCMPFGYLDGVLHADSISQREECADRIRHSCQS